MKILLPPSETKRPGGSRRVLALDELALPGLHAQRESVLAALIALSDDPDAAARVLKLSERQRGDIDDNRALRTAPTMPAIDRYTGVLFDALDAASLDAPARRWLGQHVWIHSAPFGPVGALERIPRYRLASGTSLPGIGSLRRHWAEATTAAIAESAPGFVLDLRSESYAALGPVPASVPHLYVRVVTETGRALNHFNKHAKGALVRLLAEQRPRIGSVRGLYRWASSAGVTLRPGASAGECELVAGS